MSTTIQPTPVPMWGTRNVEAYERLEQVGEGTYGQVYKGRSKDDGSIVALKKIRMTKDQEKDGFPITALREIKILKVLKHDNIINLKEIVTSVPSEHNKGKGSIFMVFEFMDHDLAGLMENPVPKFTVPQIKCYFQQLLQGLHFCHQNRVLHRDIKGANILLSNRGEVKLADFGLARPFDDQTREYTNRCITLWYRPPELLLGTKQYGPAVDLWSVGCVFFELLGRKALLPGRDEQDQFNKICELCGTPTAETWPDAERLPMYKRFVTEAAKQPQPRVLTEKLRRVIADPLAVDLLDKLLTLDPKQRISCKDALDHDYFWKKPLPATPRDLPQYKSSHDLQRKRKAPNNAAAGGQGGQTGDGRPREAIQGTAPQAQRPRYSPTSASMNRDGRGMAPSAARLAPQGARPSGGAGPSAQPPRVRDSPPHR